MARNPWRPMSGTTHGICPACKQWVELTPGGYIKEHRYIAGFSGIVGVWKSGHVVRENEIVVRCQGVGRDPKKHDCDPPRAVPGTHRWKCRCGLKWRTSHGYWKVDRDD